MATNNIIEEKLLYKDLSYKLQGLFFDIRNELGSGHKETIYQKALEKKLINDKISFKKEPSIKIYSNKGEFLGLYRPDFIIENKIIIEIKAVSYVSKQEIVRVYDYLRNSEYELAYLINFASPRLYIRRLIFTNDRKNNLNRIAKFVAICILFVAISGLPRVFAARLFFETDVQNIGNDRRIESVLKLDSQNQSINAIEGKISFSDNLKLTSVSDGDSIVGLWVQKPILKDGGILFSGIIPGGYEGDLSPFWKGDRPGEILTLSFTADKAGDEKIELNNPKVLLNDGNGTPANLSVKNSYFKITEAGTANSSNFKSIIPRIVDNTPSEEFIPQISRNPDIFGNKWFLVFVARDSESGIDHYEVLEKYPVRHIFNLIRKEKWISAESPYLLENQGLESDIFVKAVDRAGNERIAEIKPQNQVEWYENYLIWGIITILGVALVIYKYSKKKR
jgi:GxxExxY protein